MIKLATLGVLALLALAATASAETLAVDGGAIDGITLQSGVRAWYGVPFAAPPVRDLRWKAPQAVTPWSGTFHADRLAPMCLQALRFRTMNHYFGNEATSEDCLYLNVWAPPAPAPAGHPYPVLVWIYGGGFTIGSASMANYSGENLARKGVIQVNIAYRLGALGFLSHPELTREGGGSSGDYGLMDQIAALQWVRRNIAAFGGDPAKVTIAGQSAGSMSVSLLQVSPLAKGLFRGAVGMSGSAFGDLLSAGPLSDAEADGVRFQKALGAENLEAMRDLPGDRIINTPFPRRTPIVVDGKVLADTPAAIFAAHRQNDVPIMIGHTRDEAFMSLGPVAGVADYDAAVRRAFPDHADAILAAYPAHDADQARAQARLVARDATLGRMVDNWAAAQRRSSARPAYVWLFTRRQPYTPGVRFADHDPATVGAYHTGDVPYWLETEDALNLFRTTRDWTPLDRTLGDEMSNLLVSFVTSGAPADPRLPAWPAYDPSRPKMMQLGEDIRVIDWPNHAALPLLAGSPAPPPPAPGAKPRD